MESPQHEIDTEEALYGKYPLRGMMKSGSNLLPENTCD